jgi:hypothetical protein
MSQPIDRIQRVPIREVWSHEARDFSAWLSSNLDLLSEALGRQLSLQDTEVSAGDFRVDVVAEDSDGDIVIIENQLEPSNHDHLGKLVTYLASLGAKTAVWIVAEPRPEHTTAVAWLNQSTEADFFLLKAEAIRIAGSPAALLLTRIVGPSEVAKAVGQTKREFAEREHERHAFWTDLLQLASTVWQEHPHANVTANTDTWLAAGAGIASGIAYKYTVTQNECGVMLYIDLGPGREVATKAAFDALIARRESVEAAFGGPLDWQRLDDRRASAISHALPAAGGYKLPREGWPKTHRLMIDAMSRLVKSVSPFAAMLREVAKQTPATASEV